MRSKGTIKLYSGWIIFKILIDIIIPQVSGKFDVLEPLKTGETDTFRISSAKKAASLTKRCTLSANTYKVRKVQRNAREFTFYAIPGDLQELNGILWDWEITDAMFIAHQIGHIVCEIGWVKFTTVEPRARNCGISTILMELCMIDPTLTQNTDENQIYRDFRITALGGTESDQSRQAQETMRSRCLGGLIGLAMTSDSFDGGFTYLSAAQKMTYTYMIVEFYFEQNMDDPNSPCGEKFKNFEVHHAKQIYDENTGRIGDEEGSGYRARWYFCKERGRRFKRNYLNLRK